MPVHYKALLLGPFMEIICADFKNHVDHIDTGQTKRMVLNPYPANVENMAST